MEGQEEEAMTRGWGLDRPPWLPKGAARTRLPAWPAHTLIACCTPPPALPMLEDSLGGDSGDDGVHGGRRGRRRRARVPPSSAPWRSGEDVASSVAYLRAVRCRSPLPSPLSPSLHTQPIRGTLVLKHCSPEFWPKKKKWRPKIR